VQPSPCSNDASFIRISFFADIFEAGTVAPIKSDLYQLFLDSIDIIILNKYNITSSILVLHSLNIKKIPLALTISSYNFWRNLGNLVRILSVLDFSS
jgi:hypothetical protein